VRTTRFLGWRMVALAAVMLGLSGPGQTVGVSVFVDPMMASLDLTRSQVSTAYLVGTLLASLVLPRVGRALDDHGTRRTLLVVAHRPRRRARRHGPGGRRSSPSPSGSSGSGCSARARSRWSRRTRSRRGSRAGAASRSVW
jgi:hypothetical protein